MEGSLLKKEVIGVSVKNGKVIREFRKEEEEKPKLKQPHGVMFNLLTNFMKDSKKDQDSYDDKVLDIPVDRDSFVLDLPLSSLNPSWCYKDLLVNCSVKDKFKLKTSRRDYNQTVFDYSSCEGLVFDERLFTAEIVGHTELINSYGFRVCYPIVQGGSLNPYIKFLSSRSSASRRLKTINYFARMLWMSSNNKKLCDEGFSVLNPKNYNKINLMDCVLTYPKRISNYLHGLDHKEFKVLNDKLVSDYLFRMFGSKLNYWFNPHPWASSNPFDPHYHNHIYLINYKIVGKRFERIRPVVDSVKSRLIWKEILKENFPDLMNDVDNVNVHHEFCPSYQYIPSNDEINKFDDKNNYENINEDNETAKRRIYHKLKYNNRSYLVDVDKYFKKFKHDNFLDFSKRKEYYQENFDNFVNKGCVQNNTRVRGDLKHLKKKARGLGIDLSSFPKENDTLTNSCLDSGAKIRERRVVLNKDLELNREMDIYLRVRDGYVKICTLKPPEDSEKSGMEELARSLKISERTIQEIMQSYKYRVKWLDAVGYFETFRRCYKIFQKGKS